MIGRSAGGKRVRPRGGYAALAVCALGFVLGCADTKRTPRKAAPPHPPPPPSQPNAPKPEPHPGLTVGEGGVVLKGGKPFRGIGVNYFDAFYRTLKDRNDESYREGFAELARLGIPFARFMCCGFWPKDNALYFEDRERYFELLDGVVRAAEEHGIGLVPSLFWHTATVPDMVGEPVDQWGNPRSKVRDFMRTYVREVVTRYRASPAIWGWEFGNETNLSADLPNAAKHRPKIVPRLGTPDSRSARDEMTHDIMVSALEGFAREVRKHDPHRIITSGNSCLRPSAWHQWREGSWKQDTEAQFAERFRLDHPAPIDTMSVHVYWSSSKRFGRDVPVSKFLRLAACAAKDVGEPLFVGEFGARKEKSDETDAQVRERFAAILSAIEVSGAPLAALWVYDFGGQRESWNVTPSNARAWQLDAIAAANRRLVTRAGRDGTDAGAEKKHPLVFASYYVWYKSGDAKKPYAGWVRPSMRVPAGAKRHGSHGEPHIASTAYPLAGLYDSADPAVAEWHVRLAKSAGIDAFLVSWWGAHDGRARAFERGILPAAEKLGFKVALLDERAQFHKDLDQYKAMAAKFLRDYKDSPAYLRIDGRPVIYLYQVAAGPTLTPEKFAELKEYVEARVGPVYWIVDKLAHDPAAARRGDADRVKRIPEPWLKTPGVDALGFYSTFSHFRAHTHAELAGKYRYLAGLARAAGKKSLLPVHPGHDNSRFSANAYVMPRRDGATLRDYLRAASEAEADFVMVTSWNEWPETTVVEPSVTWADPYRYLRIIAEWRGVAFGDPAPPPRARDAGPK
jgi:hypothetical protein